MSTLTKIAARPLLARAAEGGIKRSARGEVATTPAEPGRSFLRNAALRPLTLTLSRDRERGFEEFRAPCLGVRP